MEEKIMTFREKFNDFFRDEIWVTVVISSREDYVVFTNLLKDLNCTTDTFKESGDLYVINLRMKDSSYSKLLNELEVDGYALADTSRMGYISKMVRIR
jgi:hypothetical protein